MFASARYRVEIALENRSNSTFKAVEINASCGCIVGLTESVFVQPGQSGKIIMDLEAPSEPGPFEKLVSLRSEFGDSIRIALRGVSIKRISVRNTNVIIAESKKNPKDIYLDVVSRFGDDLRELIWTAECAYPCTVRCSQLSDGEEPIYRLSLDLEIEGETINSASSVIYLAAKTKKGLVYLKQDVQVFFAFVASTSPKRLVLKRSGDELLGLVVVRKANYLPDGVNDAENLVSISFSENAEDVITVKASVKRGKSGCFIVDFRLPISLVPASSDNENCRLALDSAISIPIVFP